MKGEIGISVIAIPIIWAWLAGTRMAPDVAPAHHTTAGATLPTELYVSLQSGDLILRGGYGLISNSIVYLLNEPRSISHVGILVKADGHWQVWHTLSGSVSEIDGPRSELLTDFLKQSRPDALLIVRPKGGDTGELLCQANLLLMAKIPFDQQFDLTDSKALYCAEFVRYAMQQAGYPAWLPATLPNGKPYLAFSHLYDERYAELIYEAVGD